MYMCWFNDPLSSKLFRVGALNADEYLIESQSSRYGQVFLGFCMLLRLARASRCSSNWFFLLELILAASHQLFYRGIGLGYVDSLLLETLAVFFLLVEAMGSRLFLFHNSSINVTTISLDGLLLSLHCGRQFLLDLSLFGELLGNLFWHASHVRARFIPARGRWWLGICNSRVWLGQPSPRAIDA